jgi:hypothetical protein
MSLQYSVADRTNKMTQLATDVGVNAVIKTFTGSMPATCATADTGTLLVQHAGNATQFGTASAGVLTTSAVATVNAVAAGVAGYVRVYPNAATTTNAVFQGLAFQSVPLTTNALTAANGNVLNFASTTGVAVGMLVAGTGIIAGTSVIAFTGATVTLSISSTAGVANAASITFTGDFTFTNTNIASGQSVPFTSQTITAYGA